MGGYNGHSDYCSTNWKLLTPHVYENQITKEIINHQEVNIFQNSQLNAYSSRLSIIHPNIIRLIYYHAKRKRTSLCSCKSQKTVDVFVEGCISRKFDNLSKKCRCKEIIKGFKVLKKRYGTFKVTLKNIWIKENKVKVWISDDPFINETVQVDEEQMKDNIKKALKIIGCPKNHDLQGLQGNFFQSFLTDNFMKKSDNKITQAIKFNKKQQPQTAMNNSLQYRSQNYFKSASFTAQNFTNPKQKKTQISFKNFGSLRRKKTNVSFSYESSKETTKIQKVIPLSYIHLKDHPYYVTVPKINDFHENSKIHKGVQSDRTRQADISIGKSFENMGSKVTKVFEKSPPRQIINQVAIQSERNIGFSGEDDEVMQVFEFQKRNENKNVEQKTNVMDYKMPEKTKSLIKKYLTEEDAEQLQQINQSFEKQRKKRNGWQSSDNYIDSNQAKQVKSVFEDEEQVLSNSIGSAKIEMFEENRQTLKNEVDLLKQMYHPEEKQESHIKQKVQEKKANFAELKAEALKILDDGLF